MRNSDVCVRVDCISKRYRIGETVARYGRLTESLWEIARAPVKKLRRPPNRSFWALKDVSLEVKKGEVIGIIGRNGAGKTTLLKILSRITEPTSGTAVLQGKVGSLLEVGTGFHPELTGRENIFLNGAILGMKRGDIERKFDEIVQFAEVEDFLDTPVKRYSTGMGVRLAFAVAAHLDPEVLIVDEVLSVGDAAFQRRCIGKMNQVAGSGRTVLFVTHNMTTVLSLCHRACVLEAGKVVAVGAVSDVVEAYFRLASKGALEPLDARGDRGGDGSVRMTAASVESADAKAIIHSGSSLKISVNYEAPSRIVNPSLIVGVYDLRGAPIFMLSTEMRTGLPEILPPRGRISCLTNPINVTPGTCYINLALQRGSTLADHVDHAVTFEVEASDLLGSGKLPPRSSAPYVLRHDWTFEALP